MPWNVVQDPNFQKSHDKAGLLDAEEKKYLEWRNAIVSTNQGGAATAKSLGYQCQKLTGNQWEFYAGAKARISFTQDDATQLVTLQQVGHT